jgi:phage-related protein
MEIEYYISSSGNSPILKFLRKISDKNHVKQILYDIELLARTDIGQLIKTQDVKKIKGIKYDIWELRSSCVNKIYRTLFEITTNIIYILHIFNKKDEKTRPQEINIAISRLKYNKK